MASSEKDVWDFQAKSGSSGSCRLFLFFLGKVAVPKLSGKAPGSPRRPSSRHPRHSDQQVAQAKGDGPNPVLLFLGLFETIKANLTNTKDFPHRANPQKPCKTSRKHSKDQGNRPEEKDQGNKNAKEKKDREGDGAQSAKICGFLRQSAVPWALQMLEFPGEGLNLRKSAVFCENLGLGSLLARPNLHKRRTEKIEKFKLDFGDSDIRRKSVSLEHPCNGEPRPYVSVHHAHAPAACSATSVFFFALEGVEIGLRHSKCRSLCYLSFSSPSARPDSKHASMQVLGAHNSRLNQEPLPLLRSNCPKKSQSQSLCFQIANSKSQLSPQVPQKNRRKIAE